MAPLGHIFFDRHTVVPFAVSGQALFQASASPREWWI